ncbi:MAG: UDP-N-acetylmuramoyl-tripeptide--D-alanyl-D-alanine ligase [Cyanobacteria bacterium J06642_2]
MVCAGSLGPLIELLGAEAHGPFASSSFRGISTDTRTIRPGELFVAIAGENFDGHDYIQAAFERGAVGAIAEREVNAPYLKVPDTVAAYQTLARWWRSRFNIPVIGITGSVGKTSTKEMVAAALSQYGEVLKTPANDNNDIGIPRTLLQLDDSHHFVVLEMAMRGPGEIDRLARTAQPTRAIITNVGTAHIGRLGSREAIAAAKCELLKHVNAETGVALLNGEDDLLLQTAAQVRLAGKTVTYGLARGDFRANWQPHPPTLFLEQLALPVPLPGRHHALNYLATLALLHSLDLPLDSLQQGVELPPDSTGRNQLRSLPDDIQVWDETYNAAPEAMKAALQLLAQTPGQRRWAILGPMRELGDAAPQLNAEIGRMAAQLSLDGICLLDPEGEMSELAAEFDRDRISPFDNRDTLTQWLVDTVRPGDRLLFKAARAIQLETVMQDWLARRYPDLKEQA